ncbi:MAG: hypothetical protein R2991_08425 [Thermoanaerobaculia bacterium]
MSAIGPHTDPLSRRRRTSGMRAAGLLLAALLLPQGLGAQLVGAQTPPELETATFAVG